MQEIEFIIGVPSVPQTHAWAVRMANGEVITEGQNGITWDKLDHKDVDSINVLGLAVPPGCRCTMHRVSSASPGSQVSLARELVLKTEKQGVCIVHRFVVGMI